MEFSFNLFEAQDFAYIWNFPLTCLKLKILLTYGIFQLKILLKYGIFL